MSGSRLMPYKVTVVTPSYNHRQFIEHCIKSVRTQTYPHLEQIIVDNCSTDGTERVIHKHRDKYLMTWVCEPDSGQANAINKGLGLATGDIVCWLNADDVFFDNQTIQQVVSVFESKPWIDAVLGDGYIADAGGKLLSPYILDHRRLNEINMRYTDYVLQPSAF